MSRQSVGGLRTAIHGAVDVLAGREGDQSSALTTSIWCHCSPVPQMGRMCHRSPCRGICHRHHWLAQVGLTAGCIIEVKRIFLDEVIRSYQRPADYHSYTAVYNLRMNVLCCLPFAIRAYLAFCHPRFCSGTCRLVPPCSSIPLATSLLTNDACVPVSNKVATLYDGLFPTEIQHMR